VVITTVQVPFIRGGAEILAEGLLRALREAGHQAEIVAIPFKWYPPGRITEHILACRLLDLTESAGTAIDRLIGLKFPAYVAPHPNKVLWMLHQHRTAYELWDHPIADLIHHPDGQLVREAIQMADRQFIPEAKRVFTISGTVARRLRQACGIGAAPLYHPPQHADLFCCAEAEDYLFFPSRLVAIKRQSLVLEALARTRHPVQVRFAGTADHPPYAAELEALAERLGIGSRAAWLGAVSEEEKRALYARALGVVYPPVDEDYGYVTLEAMLSAKPLITCADSGGPLEFVRHEETGLVAEPEPASLAEAMDALWERRARARSWGEAGRREYDRKQISWPHVVEALLA
jgi:glycosyltransferase involved in cell wall biosynthesis